MMKQQKQLLGWREWISLPDLNIDRIKAKIDTGARTSALHAFNIQRYRKHQRDKLKFLMHPLQKNSQLIIECHADIIDYRWVTDSGGHKERRYVILSTAIIGCMEKKIELTLTNRDSMQFRMLLGRTALKRDFLVDAAQSYLLEKKENDS